MKMASREALKEGGNAGTVSRVITLFSRYDCVLAILPSIFPFRGPPAPSYPPFSLPSLLSLLCLLFFLSHSPTFSVFILPCRTSSFHLSSVSSPFLPHPSSLPSLIQLLFFLSPSPSSLYPFFAVLRLQSPIFRLLFLLLPILHCSRLLPPVLCSLFPILPLDLT